MSSAHILLALRYERSRGTSHSRVGRSPRHVNNSAIHARQSSRHRERYSAAGFSRPTPRGDSGETGAAVAENVNREAANCGAGGGNRTRTPLARPRILSPVRLPVPPPRPVSGFNSLRGHEAAPTFFSGPVMPKIMPAARSIFSAASRRTPASTIA
jgi:hypothetical protein